MGTSWVVSRDANMLTAEPPISIPVSLPDFKY